MIVALKHGAHSERAAEPASMTIGAPGGGASAVNFVGREMHQPETERSQTVLVHEGNSRSASLPRSFSRSWCKASGGTTQQFLPF